MKPGFITTETKM